jgi:hypothetical protein
MILLAILLLIVIILVTVMVLTVSAVGAGAILLFGDVIVCLGVIGFIIYRIIRKKFR